MPVRGYDDLGPRERLPALAAAALIQAGFVLALLIGLRVPISRVGDVATRLIDVELPRPPLSVRPKRAEARPAHPPSPHPEPSGRSPGPVVAPAAPVVPRVPLPTLPAGGGSGMGNSAGIGSGSGGDSGEGEGGGTDLVQIAGAILPSDYPRALRERGIGGRVGVLFTVGPNGRVTRCSITRPSGVPELDALTCRLIQERFIYRPSTDSRGQPIADEVEGEHDWVARERQ